MIARDYELLAMDTTPDCEGCAIGSDNQTHHELGCPWTERFERGQWRRTFVANAREGADAAVRRTEDRLAALDAEVAAMNAERDRLRRVSGLTESVEVDGQRVRNGMVATRDGVTLTVATETGQVTVPAGTFGTVAL